MFCLHWESVSQTVAKSTPLLRSFEYFTGNLHDVIGDGSDVRDVTRRLRLDTNVRTFRCTGNVADQTWTWVLFSSRWRRPNNNNKSSDFNRAKTKQLYCRGSENLHHAFRSRRGQVFACDRHKSCVFVPVCCTPVLWVCKRWLWWLGTDRVSSKITIICVTREWLC